MDDNQEARDERRHRLEKILADLKVHLSVRLAELVDREALLHHKITVKGNKLGGRTKKATSSYVILTSASLQLDCRMHRRGVFFLMRRVRAFEQEILSLQGPLDGNTSVATNDSTESVDTDEVTQAEPSFQADLAQ